MSNFPNLENLSIEELILLQDQTAKQIKKTQRAEKKATLKKMDALAQQSGYANAAEMLSDSGGRAPRKDRGIKAPPKYELDGKTWSGKGRVPGWMLDYEKKKGKKRDDLLIEK
jgi:DNA-binding protein H-NS